MDSVSSNPSSNNATLTMMIRSPSSSSGTGTPSISAATAPASLPCSSTTSTSSTDTSTDFLKPTNTNYATTASCTDMNEDEKDSIVDEKDDMNRKEDENEKEKEEEEHGNGRTHRTMDGHAPEPEEDGQEITQLSTQGEEPTTEPKPKHNGKIKDMDEIASMNDYTIADDVYDHKDEQDGENENENEEEVEEEDDDVVAQAAVTYAAVAAAATANHKSPAEAAKSARKAAQSLLHTHKQNNNHHSNHNHQSTTESTSTLITSLQHHPTSSSLVQPVGQGSSPSSSSSSSAAISSTAPPLSSPLSSSSSSMTPAISPPPLPSPSNSNKNSSFSILPYTRVLALLHERCSSSGSGSSSSFFPVTTRRFWKHLLLSSTSSTTTTSYALLQSLFWLHSYILLDYDPHPPEEKKKNEPITTPTLPNASAASAVTAAVPLQGPEDLLFASLSLPSSSHALPPMIRQVLLDQLQLQQQQQQPQQENRMIDTAIQQVSATVLHIHGAYECLESMLPKNKKKQQAKKRHPPKTKQTPKHQVLEDDDAEEDGILLEEEEEEEESASYSSSDSAVVDHHHHHHTITTHMDILPDLLPLCTTPQGDSTWAFYRACMGDEIIRHDHNYETKQQVQADKEKDTETINSPEHSPARNKPLPRSPESSSSPIRLPLTAAMSSSFLGNVFRRASSFHAYSTSSINTLTAADSEHSSSHSGSIIPTPPTLFSSSFPSASASASSSSYNITSSPTSTAFGTGSAAGLSAVFRSKKSVRSALTSSASSSSGRSSSTTTTEATATATEEKSNSIASRSNASATIASSPPPVPPGCYTVKIEREMLGLTVENVLERTVVRTVLPGGPAKKAGAQVGSLIMAVGTTSTRHLTHFETIDELRQSQRPLLLLLRPVGEEALRLAREEMGRLVRGAGFGMFSEASLSLITSHTHPPHIPSSNHTHATQALPTTAASVSMATATASMSSNNSADEEGTEDRAAALRHDVRLDTYGRLIQRRWESLYPRSSPRDTEGNNDHGVEKLGEKLLWVLTLFAYGLEREASRHRRRHHHQHAYSDSLGNSYSGNKNDPSGMPASPQRRHVVTHSLTYQAYADASRSVGKVLWEYIRKTTLLPILQRLAPPAPPPPSSPRPLQASYSRRSPYTKQQYHPGHAASSLLSASGKNITSAMSNSIIHTEKPLLQVGDVLQRTRTFLADTASPPAALFRGELISLLCDVLDCDTEMELAESESSSASIDSISHSRSRSIGGSGGGGVGGINDLGSAGSLLKLIVLNASIIMRSRGDHNAALAVHQEEKSRRYSHNRRAASSATTEDVPKLHAGNRFMSVVHRLAASRSTSARITACSLGPVLWGYLDFPHQLQLRGVITRALHDVDIMVRKATVTVLHEIAELVYDRRCVPWLVLMCERAMTDPEPQLRSAAMTLTWHLAEHLPNAFLGNARQGSRFLRRLPKRDDPIFADVYLLQCKILPVATRLAEDRSPSVRLAVAAQCDRLCDALGDHWSSVIIDVLLALLSDADERVRCEAVACVPRLAEIVLLSVSPGGTSVSEISVLEALLPAAIKLQQTSCSSVRVALAAAAGELLGLMVAMQARAVCPESSLSSSNIDATFSQPASPHRHAATDPDEAARKYKRQVDDRMIPLLQSLLNDKDPEVTSAALRAVTNATRRSIQQPRHRHLSTASFDDDSVSISSYQSSHTSDRPVLTPVLSEKQVLRLLPTLSHLAASKQWRVRQSAVEIVPALLGCTSQHQTRAEISQLCVRLMKDDPVDAVRKTAAECLCMGGSSLGSHGEDASAEWMTSIVVPVVRQFATDSRSKQRQLSLKMVQTVLLSGTCPVRWKAIGPQDDSSDENHHHHPTTTSNHKSSNIYDDPNRLADTPIRELAAIALSLTNDPVANVRLNVGRCLDPVLNVFEEDDIEFIQAVLLQQIESERESGKGDGDVLHYARHCVHKATVILEDRANALILDDRSHLDSTSEVETHSHTTE